MVQYLSHFDIQIQQGERKKDRGQYETKINVLSNLSKDGFTIRPYQKSGIDQLVQ